MGYGTSRVLMTKYTLDVCSLHKLCINTQLRLHSVRWKPAKTFTMHSVSKTFPIRIAKSHEAKMNSPPQNSLALVS